MRYYHFSLGINAQAIRENEELGRHWNSYEETLEVINEYMTKNLRNHLSFLAYREEEKSIPAVFAYDPSCHEFFSSQIASRLRFSLPYFVKHKNFILFSCKFQRYYTIFK